MKEKAFLAVVVAAIIASLGGLFIKYISMNATSIAWLRTTVPTLVLASMVFREPRIRDKKKTRQLILLSIISSLRIYLFILAYVFTSIANAAILFYIYPVFILIVANQMIGEKITRRQLILILIAFLGLIIVYSDQKFSFQNEDFLGMLAAILAAIVFAFVIVMMKGLQDSYSKSQILFYQNLSGAVLFLPFFLVDIENFNLANLGYGIGYGVLIGVITYSLILVGLKHMKASITSSIMYLEVPFTILLGYLVLNESLTPNMIIGGILIIICSYLLRK